MDDLPALRAILATLYPTQEDIRRIAADVSLNLAFIQFSGRAINDWHNVLTEAQKHNRIELLFEIVLSEYGANSDLINAVQAYRSTDHQQAANVEDYSSMIGNATTSITYINTGGAPYIAGNVNTGGDFVGRDQKTAAPDSTTNDPSPNDLILSFEDAVDVNVQPIKWPPLWFSPVEEPTRIAEWVRMAQLKFNPFGPEQAERDPNLLEHYVYPQVFEECLRNVRSAIIFGASGSGKTACKLLLTHACYTRMSESQNVNVFPVPCSIDLSTDTMSTVEAVQNFVIEQLSHTLVPFFALNPLTFLTLDEEAKLATAACLLHTFLSTENVKTQLFLAGLHNRIRSAQVWLELDRLALHLQNASFTQRNWTKFISNARPKNFSHTFIICELANMNLPTLPLQAVHLQRLIDYVVSPSVRSVYLKALFPDILTSCLTIPDHVTQCSLVWTVELLEKMLKERVRAEGEHKIYFEQLFDHAARSTNPARRLAEAAHGSPQQLIRLGNRLLEAHVRNRPGEIEISNRELTTTLRQRKRISN